MNAHSHSPAADSRDVARASGRPQRVDPAGAVLRQGRARGRLRDALDRVAAAPLSQPPSELAPRQLAYLTEVDHRDHEALVALDDGGVVIGVARYIRLRGRRLRSGGGRSPSSTTGSARDSEGIWFFASPLERAARAFIPLSPTCRRTTCRRCACCASSASARHVPMTARCGAAHQHQGALGAQRSGRSG